MGGGSLQSYSTWGLPWLFASGWGWGVGEQLSTRMSGWTGGVGEQEGTGWGGEVGEREGTGWDAARTWICSNSPWCGGLECARLTSGKGEKYSGGGNGVLGAGPAFFTYSKQLLATIRAKQIWNHLHSMDQCFSCCEHTCAFQHASESLDHLRISLPGLGVLRLNEHWQTFLYSGQVHQKAILDGSVKMVCWPVPFWQHSMRQIWWPWACAFHLVQLLLSNSKMLLQTEGKVCLHSIVNKHRQAVWKRPGWTGWEVLDPLEKKA